MRRLASTTASTHAATAASLRNARSLTLVGGLLAALSTAGCGLLLDTSPPDVFADGSVFADGGGTDAAPERDAGRRRDAAADDGGTTLMDEGIDLGDAGPDLDAGADPDAGADAGDAPDAGADADAGPPDLGLCLDADHDGVTTCAGDCNDADPLSAPGNPELCLDGADNNCNGAIDEGCGSSGLGTFVSTQTGDDANPGTRALPVATIGQGMENAGAIGLPQTVVVAGGTYREKVTMAEGVDLLGGYECEGSACTWARAPSVYVSTIENTDFEGVLAPAGVTNETLFEGFYVAGLRGTPMTIGSAGITLLGGSPTIRGNAVVGGDVSGGLIAERSIGIHLRSTSDAVGAVIERNDVRGGMSGNMTVAVLFDSAPLTTTALATVRGNTLRGGTGVRSTGLAAWNSLPGTLVANNDIFAGNSARGASHGIELASTLTIDGNRINANPLARATCTTPLGWCAGIASQSSTAVITNNVVYGPNGPRSTAVLLAEAERPAGTVLLNGNLLDGGGSESSIGGTTTASAAVVVSIGLCTTCGFHGVVGRVRNNVLLGGAGSVRFGVLEDPALARTVHPELLQNNLFFFSPAATPSNVLYRTQTSTGGVSDILSIAAVNALLAPPAAANLAGDPLLDATWHALPGSPCIDHGTLEEAPPFDFERDARPRGAAVDIGPDES